MAAKKIALFIDADNISAKFGKQIIDALENRGEIFIRHIYGNWEKILSLKDSGHSKLTKFISAFPNLYELKEHSYRCR